jgi:hypothetical protein
VSIDEEPMTATCPICGKPPEPKYKPFCSARCADVDLHRWMSGNYAIPAGAGTDPDEAEEAETEDPAEEDRA